MKLETLLLLTDSIAKTAWTIKVKRHRRSTYDNNLPLYSITVVDDAREQTIASIIDQPDLAVAAEKCIKAIADRLDRK